MLVLLIHSLVAEHANFGRLAPSYLLHSVVLLMGISISCWYYNQPVEAISTTWLSILSVIVCFSGFMAYLIANIVANIFLAIDGAWKIFWLKMPEKIESHRKDMARYKPELDAIDTQLRSENLSPNISVAAENTYTNQ